MKQQLIFSVVFLCFFSLCTGLHAQDPGDEGAVMYNNPQTRDAKAIQEATTGWWKADMQYHDQRIAWWREARFGMFIHWGIYALAAGEWNGKPIGGYAEHLMRKEKITRKDYLKLAAQFDPVAFQAAQWVLAAKKAGMQYMIVTAKHHDGFAMYDTKYGDFNLLKQTPFHRDPLAELQKACRQYGLKFGFYYSHAFDWEHPDAPGNDWEYENPGGDRLLGGANWYDNHPEWLPKVQQYVDEKAIPQIQELLSKYHPDILWFDTPHKLPLSENLRILKAIRAVDHQVVVNGRLARTNNQNFGDYQNTADRPAEFFPVKGDWEAIPTTNESYGYSKYDTSHKPASFFIQLLAKAASKGGNLLLNIGPKGDGKFDGKDTRILDSIGLWMDKYQGSIINTEASGLPVQTWGVSTLKQNKLYLHVFDWPKNGVLDLGGLENAVADAHLLIRSHEKLAVERLSPTVIRIHVPKQAPDSVNSVVELNLSNLPLRVDSVRLLSSEKVNRLLAYDAQLIGGGFSYGDGKPDRDYVAGWKKPAQEIRWVVQVLQPARYRVRIRYASSKAGQEYVLALDNKVVLTQQTQTDTSAAYQVADLGEIAIAPQPTAIQLKTFGEHDPELMKVFEIELIPIDR